MDLKDEKDLELDNYLKMIAHNNMLLFDNFYELIKNDIYAFALSILKDRMLADDVFQEVFIKIISNAKRYKSKGKPLAWILKITKNECLMKLRKNKEESTALEDVETIIDSKNKFTIDEKILMETLLKELTSSERQIIVLHDISGFKNKEIAQMLNIPLSTILSKYNRAIKKLSAQLERI